MALTAAEKMRRRREKLKNEGKYEEYKQKQREEMKKVRERKKNELAQLSSRKRNAIILEDRRKTKLRVQKCRELKKQNLKSPKSYKNPASLAKAVSRVSTALPKSPRKKKCVVRKLYESVIGSEVQLIDKKTPRSSALEQQVVEKVKSFYERDDISRQAPGMKDVITVKENGVKIKLQARHLYSSIRETHALFCSENTDIEIGKSKFCELRPKNVKTSNKMPHNVCLCKYHENFILAVNALHDIFPLFPKYSGSFWEDYLCQPSTESCWLSSCEECHLMLQLSMAKLLERDGIPTNITSWICWKELDDGRLSKVTLEGEVEDLVKYINSLRDQFLEHVYIKREQAKSYQNDRNITRNLETYVEDVALVQVDFAENYTCTAQQEVQSYHWKQPQVSIFTCSICYNGNQFPYVFLSDNLDHTKETIIVYMAKILEEIPSTIKEVRVWSDGPSSQFKNKYIAVIIKSLQEKYKKQIIWNYFATSHGKGPVDGIGGSVKRQVRQEVISHKDIVQNASDFFKVAKKACKVKAVLVQEEDMHSVKVSLDSKSLFEDADPVSGISKAHAILWKRNSLQTFPLSKNIKAAPTDQSQPSTSSGIRKQRIPYHFVYSDTSEDSDVESDNLPDQNIKEEDIKNGTFVLVKFSDHKDPSTTFKYAAICQSSVDEFKDVEVMCLKNIKNCRTFKTDETDVTFVKLEQIFTILPLPEMKMKGGRYYYHFKKSLDVKEK